MPRSTGQLFNMLPLNNCRRARAQAPVRLCVFDRTDLIGFIDDFGRRNILAIELIGDMEREVGTFASRIDAMRALHRERRAA